MMASIHMGSTELKPIKIPRVSVRIFEEPEITEPNIRPKREPRSFEYSGTAVSFDELVMHAAAKVAEGTALEATAGLPTIDPEKLKAAEKIANGFGNTP